MRHRNVGAPFKRVGEGVSGMWGRHEVHEPTARELELWHRKLRPVEDPISAARDAQWRKALEEMVDGAVDRYATGGGWYRLPSGHAVQGRDKAVRALRAEQADEADTSTTSEETP